MKLAIIFTLLHVQVFASSVLDLKVPNYQRDLQLKVVGVQHDDLDIFDLEVDVYQSEDRELKLLCSFNPFYEYQKSSLIRTNKGIYNGAHFRLSDTDCLSLFNFFKAHHEHVTKDTPLEVVLDREEMKVLKIKLHSPDIKSPKIDKLALEVP